MLACRPCRRSRFGGSGSRQAERLLRGEKQIIMTETIGTLNLKIARLQHQLAILEQQQNLGRAYPDFQVVLRRKMTEIEHQLRQLIQSREELSGYVAQNTQKGIFNGDQRPGPESIYAVN